MNDNVTPINPTVRGLQDTTAQVEQHMTAREVNALADTNERFAALLEAMAVWESNEQLAPDLREMAMHYRILADKARKVRKRAQGGES